MKLGGVILGLLLAVLAHGLVLTFGGIFFMDDEEQKPKTLEVELVAPEDASKDKKEEEQKVQAETKEELAPDEEPPPDAAEMLRNLELASVTAGPALEAASLAEIEQALNGTGGGGDFSSGVSFNSGGTIGASGLGKAFDKKMEEAFNADDIDQKPRLLFPTSPVYPNELRGKKLEGDVTVIFVVDETGKVNTPKAVKSNNPAFEKPALDAIKQWKFEPGLKGGKRVPCRMKISVRFPAS
jgi:protein TonB